VTETTYQLVMDEQGRVVDVRRGKSPPGWSTYYPSARATCHFTSRGVPRHVCYDDPRQTHPADAAFCRTARVLEHSDG